MVQDEKILVAANATLAGQLTGTLARAGFLQVRVLDRPRDALDGIDRWEPGLLALDLALEEADPLELLERLGTESEDGKRPALLGLVGEGCREETVARAVEGGLDEILRLPASDAEAGLRVESCLARARAGRGAREGEPEMEVLHILARLVEYRDFKTERHAERVGELSAKIALELGMSGPEVERIRAAAPLHDIGMAVVPDHILLKEGRLSHEERKIMMTHAANGARILSESQHPVMRTASLIAHTHHERWDGDGYPRGLQGEEIPLVGRIVAVADAFEAITHNRPFREAESAEQALEKIRHERGRQFDPNVVDALLAVKERETTTAR